MKWLKEVIIDIIVTLFIILAVILYIDWIKFIVLVYTPLLLFIKVLIFFGESFLKLMKRTYTKAPLWFSHLLYGINLSVLFAFKWWITAIQWALIWLVSWLTHRKLQHKKLQQKNRKKH